MAGYWRPATTTDLNNPNIQQNDSGNVWDTRTLPSELKVKGTMAQLQQALATGGDLSAIGFSEINPNASSGLSDNRTQLQNMQQVNPGGSVVTGPDGKQYWQYNPGSFGDAGLEGSFMDFIKPLAMIGGIAAGAGLMGAFSGAAGIGEGAGAMESVGTNVADFGTNAFDFGGATGTTPLTGGGGFGASSINDLVSTFTQQFGMSPSNAMSLAQKVGGALSSTGGKGGMATTSGGMDTTGIAGLISGGTGLFDLFSKGPYSSTGITDKAAATADPLMGDRAGYGGMLKQLMTNPDSFSLTPDAQNQMKYGTENLMRSNAAKGLLGSGNVLADIMKFGEGVSSQDFWKQIDELNLLSGAKTGSPAAAGQIQTRQLNNRNDALSNIGGGMAALSPQVASILKSLGITDPSTYTAGNDGSFATGVSDMSSQMQNFGETTVPAAPDVGSFGAAASGSTLEDLFSFA